uniref:WW domain-containing protein n=1 Tax=Lotharella globosa TaxID=91324 RepID=A0A7S3YER4_9EUKA
MGAALSDCRNESGCMPGAPARSWESTTVPSENNSSQLPEETLIQFVDEKRGLPYYYDLKTGETTWETPDQFLVHPSVVEWMEGAYEGTSPIARATRHASEFRMVQPPVNEPQQRDTSVPVKQSGVRIAVLCTKEEDAKPLRKMMRDACEQMLKGCVRRTRGKIHGKLVDLVITGKGKVNASCAVVALCYESTPNSHLAAILSLGRTAANAKEVGEADVIVCSGVMTEDSESSRKESSELKIEADSKLLACTRKKIGDVSLRICEGPVDESWITLMCPKKHTMCKVRGLPKAYVGKHSGVFCDQCELTGLENLDPFWHCAECGWDYCSKCSEEKDVNRIVRSPLSWSVEQDQRVDLRQERFSFVVSEDKVPARTFARCICLGMYDTFCTLV